MRGERPSSVGATHRTVACPGPGVAVTPVGAPGGAGQGYGRARTPDLPPAPTDRRTMIPA
ncbi:hypothetical protein NOCARDAX2BIS_200019 [Nocardioides sp. AX2bis]|nr:hypothetical protein NOCARDAX2BIS_200019 [Nocardioides sp. AX2bis]